MGEPSGEPHSSILEIHRHLVCQFFQEIFCPYLKSTLARHSLQQAQYFATLKYPQRHVAVPLKIKEKRQIASFFNFVKLSVSLMLTKTKDRKKYWFTHYYTCIQ